jgi:uncharacterized protein (TIGR01777 family)
MEFLMNILVTGATGFIGSRLCELLHEAGYGMSALSRHPASARRRVPSLDRVFPWNSVDAPPPAEALDRVHGVIHLAGERINGPWSPAKKRAIVDSRVLGTHHLVEGIKALDVRPKVLISASAIGYYGDRGEEELTEDASPGTNFLARICHAWEQEAGHARGLGLRVVHLRTGIVLGSDGGALKTLSPLFKMGLGGPLGSGRQWWSWIHREDLVHLILHILERPMSGPVNATAPDPVRQKAFSRTLGRVLRRPAFLPAPSWMLKLVLGEFSSELLSSRRVLPQSARETGYAFRFPTLESSLRDILTDS